MIDDGVHDSLPACSSPPRQSKASAALRNATIRKEAVHASAMDLHRRLLTATRAYLAGIEAPMLASFIDGADWSMEERALSAGPLPCLHHLDRISSIAEEGREIIGFLAGNRNAFHWGQTYSEADFGPDFIENYGWMELFGTRGHFANERMAGGFLILGPHLHYPDHHHFAEEIYIPLTGGTAWRRGDGVYLEKPAGAVIHHPSNVSHAMKTGAEPLLALYLWRGGPLAERSTVTGRAAQA
jgi:hypothetical protein